MKMDVWKRLETHENYFCMNAKWNAVRNLFGKEVKRWMLRAISKLLFLISLWSPVLIWFSVSTHFIKAKVIISLRSKAAISQLSRSRQAFLSRKHHQEISAGFDELAANTRQKNLWKIDYEKRIETARCVYGKWKKTSYLPTFFFCSWRWQHCQEVHLW